MHNVFACRQANLAFESQHRNERYDDGGGAIRTTDDAGEVNIAECVFYRNAGTMGGAIFSRAFRLNIVSTNMTQNEATVRSPSASHWHSDICLSII